MGVVIDPETTPPPQEDPPNDREPPQVQMIDYLFNTSRGVVCRNEEEVLILFSIVMVS